MTAIQRSSNRMSSWALSIVLHGGLAVFATLSVYDSRLEGSGGSERGGDVSPGDPSASESFAVSFRGSELVIPGFLPPDTFQYAPLTFDESFAAEAGESPASTIQFDVLAVGPRAPKQSAFQTFEDYSPPRPGASASRLARILAASNSGGEQQGPSGSAAPGGDPSQGKEGGTGSGEGMATGVSTPTPRYPGEARRRKLEGSVRVELAIAADGSCTLLRILEGSGFPLLDLSVEETVRRWKYRSAEEDGRPALTIVRVRFVFKLDRQGP